MTNFLPAGIISDTINDICQKVLQLKDENDLLLLKQGLEEIEDLAFGLAIFLEKLSCDPLIYTGTGSTEEIIKRLDWALSFSEGIEPGEYLKYKTQAKKF